MLNDTVSPEQDAVDAAVITACEIHNQAEPQLKLIFKTTNRKIIDTYFLKAKKKAKVPAV